MAWLTEKITETTYRSNLRAITRALWTGVVDVSQFFDVFDSIVRRGLEQAWYDGSAKCGIKPDELTPEERAEMRAFITNQTTRVFSFGLDIEDGSKANGGKLRGHFYRVEMWANQFTSCRMKAQAMACADQKTMWVLGDAEHCSSCLKLAGKIKRMSYWRKVGVLPRNAPNSKLKCGGWRCQCSLVKTNKPASKGPLPRLP